ncbi:phosphatidate cytidylyltransferase [Segetibacter koreensis]|uniref:phosphatidate cytidylyltransferase n=1 Tax=Segetibacter koreensis TaxID=398037 RepID=UPI00037B4422|nr:phosphatidate cytidylyltransferase [Segetibacter koreensis]
MNNLSKRLITGAFLILVITASIIEGTYSFIALLILINCLALLEFYHLFHSKFLTPRNISGMLLSLVMLITFSLVVCHFYNWKILLVSIPFAFLIFAEELYFRSANPFQNIAITFLGIIYITIPVIFFIAIAFFPFPQSRYHPYMMLCYFLVLWTSDSGAYVVGKAIGKHKLFERISPNKTWEGSIGGAILALLVSYFATHFLLDTDTVDWVIITLLIVVFGTVGDLTKSLMKRSLNIKDAGTILPGHGGMLDRFDSLLGSAPFVFAYLILFKE